MPHRLIFVRIVVVFVAVVSAASTGDALPGRSRSIGEGWPAIVIWAWDRPESLRFIDPAIGVAYLDRTIEVRQGRIAVRPRQQKLLIPPATALVSVVRLETRDTSLAPDTLAALSLEIARAAERPCVHGVQVDFDATASQRAFYAALLAAVRGRLHEGVVFSMTALASWCADQAWLQTIDVDE